jgi:hypothetical protein
MLSSRELWVVGVSGFLAMFLYAPFVKIERTFVVVPVRHAGSSVVSMGHTNEVRSVRTQPAGYAWIWSRPHELAWLGAEIEFQLYWPRLALQSAIWFLLLLAFGVFRNRTRPASSPATMPLLADA